MTHRLSAAFQPRIIVFLQDLCFPESDEPCYPRQQQQSDFPLRSDQIRLCTILEQLRLSVGMIFGSSLRIVNALLLL